MKPEEFKTKWNDPLSRLSPLSPDKLKVLNLKKETSAFLSVSGLPDSAAPFLSFVTDTNDSYNRISKLTDQYNFLEPAFDKYIVIGSDGGGNPIVINTEENDCIQWLDHENDFIPAFMNTSIHTLADFLFYYLEFIQIIIHKNGKDAFLENQFTDEQFQKVKDKLTVADPKAVREGFWKAELDMLIFNRDN